jgi:transcriptional regulator with XRE-family HTH domain
MVTGKTQEEVAEKIGVDESTVRWIVYSGLSDPPVPISSDPPIPDL